MSNSKKEEAEDLVVSVEEIPTVSPKFERSGWSSDAQDQGENPDDT